MQDVGATAVALQEALNEPRRTIKYFAWIVQTIGIENIERYLKQTDQLYQEGSLLIKNGTRKRSLGGTFFYLIRQDYPELAAINKTDATGKSTSV